MTAALQVVTAAGSRDEAEKIARELVARRLAGCAQVSGPIKSFYHWQGTLETSQEWLCILKTLPSHYAALEAAICELHSYDVPEILAFQVVEGSRDYLSWLGGELSPPGEQAE
jgi:periplasmic divalent cation tolerance protein